MSWLKALEIGLDVANVAVNLSNMSKLEELRRQGASDAVLQQVVKELRDRIFAFKQSAESVLSYESTSHKITAGAMKLLEMRLDDSGITPDAFRELMDKEYAANTIRLIRQNSARLMNELTIEERSEVFTVCSTVQRMPDYDYYLSNYDDRQKLRDAELDIVRCTGKKLNGLVNAIVILAGIFSAFGIGPGIYLFSPYATGSASEILIPIVSIIVFIISYTISRAQKKNRETLATAEETVKRLSRQIHVKRMDKLHEEFRGTDVARQKQREGQSIIRNFFGDAQLLLN